jgi:DNA-binding NarL/FixJ family response regulator
MTEIYRKQTVAVCDTQPVTAEGLKMLLGSCSDLEFCEVVDSLDSAGSMLRRRTVNILIVDKGLGMHSVLDWLNNLKMTERCPAIVVWGVSVTEAEALRFLQAGARGIIRKTADLSTLLICMRTVAAGRSWMEDSVFRDSVRPERYPRSELTAREHQVLELVEQGFKNKEIAIELGIRPGTVKIHLKHIFEKTGVRGRYGLAISGLKDKGVVSLAS